MILVNTPYDDVFKTLANDCSELLIPVINEGFQEHFAGNEKIIFYPNEHFINQQNGQEAYGSVLKVSFPNSAVLYLRSNASTPDTMHVQMITPGGELFYPIRVMKMKNYTLNELFDKNLLFLIPFYIFVHEHNFIEYNKDTDKLHNLLNEYEEIKNKLESLNNQGSINEFTKQAIIDMTKKVIEHITKNYEQIRKGVNAVMGGKVLEYEAKTILNKGRAEGKQLGLLEGKIAAYAEMVRDGFISASEAATRLNLSVEEIQEFLKTMK